MPKAHLSACLPFETRFTLSQPCDGRAPSHWPSRSRPTCRSTAHIQRQPRVDAAREWLRGSQSILSHRQFPRCRAAAETGGVAYGRGGHPRHSDGAVFGPGRINWNVGDFRTYSFNDILNVPSAIARRGFFENAGDTRRQGSKRE